MHPASACTPRFAAHVNAAKGTGAASGSVRAELAAMPVEQRVEALTHMLAEQVAGVLGIPGDSVDWHTPLPELGLDSLMAVELRARVNRRAGRGDLRAGTEPQRRACPRLPRGSPTSSRRPDERRSGSGATATTFHREDPPKRPTV